MILASLHTYTSISFPACSDDLPCKVFEYFRQRIVDSASARLEIKSSGNLTLHHILKKQNLSLLLYRFLKLISNVDKLARDPQDLMVRQELRSDELLCSVVTDVFRGRHESSNEGTQDS